MREGAVASVSRRKECTGRSEIVGSGEGHGAAGAEGTVLGGGRKRGATRALPAVAPARLGDGGGAGRGMDHPADAPGARKATPAALREHDQDKVSSSLRIARRAKGAGRTPENQSPEN